MSKMHQSGYLPWDRNGNRVLLQSELGKSKPSTYNLPDQQFMYGKITPQDPEKANTLMYGWKQHQRGANPNINKQKDLIQTNRKCIKSLLHTSSGFTNFRKTSVSFKKIQEGSRMIGINLPEENFTYGKPLDLEDPIKLVIANNYGQTDKLARHTFYESQQLSQSQVKRKLSCHITKNHQLVKQATQKRLQKFNWLNHEPAMWKMNRFKNISARTQTNNKSRHTKSSLQSSSAVGQSE